MANLDIRSRRNTLKESISIHPKNKSFIMLDNIKKPSRNFKPILVNDSESQTKNGKF